MSANIVTVDEESLRKDIENLVRRTVEETLNALLDEEASELVGAGRYERTAGRCVSSRGLEQKEHRNLSSLSIGSVHAF